MAITKASAQTTVNSGTQAAAAATVNQITVAPATATTVAGGGTLGGVTISNVSITDSTFANVLSGDTAVSTAGGFVKITGTGFKTAANVLLGSTALANTFVSATQINANIPASSAATYQFTVFNTDGSGAIYSPGLLVSGPPSWTTTSYSASALTLDIQLLASGDAPLTYYIQPGSANPQNLAVNSAGYLSGTVSAEGAYTITVIVDDAQGQSTQADITVTISVSDVYFNRTTVALPADTTTWVTDASTNAYVLTVNGDTRPIAFSPYNNNFSVKFDGSNDFISVPAGSDFSFGTGDFTIECFVNTTDNSLAPGGYSRSIMRIGDFDFYLRITQYHGGTDGALRVDGLSDGSTVVIKDGLWHHIALVRQSNIIRLWIDGIYQTSGSGATYSTNHTNADLNVIGGRSNPTTGYFNGYITNVRVVKGTAVYTGTSNFTVPTAPLTAIANTVLLTCAKNRFIDANTTPKTITVGDAPVISSWTPLIETDTTTASGYFDGTGDDLTIPTNSAFTYSTGDFTIEMWVYITANPADYAYIYGQGPNSTASMSLYIQSGKFNIWNGSNIIAGATTYLLNTWYHVAISRSSTSLRLFLNGVQDGSVTNSSNITTGSTLGASIGRWAEIGDNRYFTGYISNVRVVKGTAVYTANFTPPASPLTAIANTSLLTLQYRIGENNNRFIDQSNLNHLITRNGNATQGSFSPFSQTGWSNYFDGSSTLRYTGSPISTSQSNLTIEAWVYPTQTPTFGGAVGQVVVDANGTTGGSYWGFGLNTSLNVIWRWYDGASGFSTTSVGTISLNQWSHIAVSITSNNITLYINGTLQSITGTSTLTNRGGNTGYVNIGRYATTDVFYGYISNARLVAGTGLYTSSFIPSTSPLTAVSNTSLLTCQNNRFVDNSTSNCTITIYGNPSVQAFSPFAPTTEYVPATHGGSGYFDGTGDYIVTPANSVFSLPGDFTLECWIYSVATQGQYAAVLCNVNTTDGFYFSFSNSSNNMGFSNYGTYFISSSSTPIVNNVWTHIALTRSGTTLRMFFNGEIVGTGTSAANFGSSVSGTTVGFNGVNHFFNGYVSNARIVKGTAVYTAAFTPPTAPLTAIANTSLLLNFTNAGIVDATAKNFFETVGAARSSTAISKFGGSSVFIPDTGNYIQNRTNYDVSFGSGDFTIEAWIYWNSLVSESAIMHGDGVGWTFYIYPANRLQWGTTSPQSPANLRTGNTTLATGQWYHIAVTRSGTTVTMWVNGVSDGTVTDSSNYSAAGKLRIGTSHSNYGFNGYMDDIRITKGFARYTANFTPPTATFKLR